MTEYVRAVVVFSSKRKPILFGRRARPSFWLRWLRPGFTHCFVTVLTEAGWIGIDPLAHHAKVLWSGGTRDLSGRSLCRIYTVDKGLTAAVYVMVKPGRRRRIPPWPATCTEVVRRVLGLPGWPLTPWRLYRMLARYPGTIYRNGPPI